MDKKQIIKQTEKYVRERLKGDGSGHDWWHIYRVWNMAKVIGKTEEADMFVVDLAALLHDVADWKFQKDGDDEVGSKIAREWLEKFQIEEKIVSHVCQIIKNSSFKGAGVKTRMETKEGMIVQDADRLDAIGAIGIGRAFAYGGSKRRGIYSPDIKPDKHETFEDYKKSDGTTINHFYEKLLLLKELMNTEAAKKIAKKRHEFMKIFLDEFFMEWEGKK